MDQAEVNPEQTKARPPASIWAKASLLFAAGGWVCAFVGLGVMYAATTFGPSGQRSFPLDEPIGSIAIVMVSLGSILNVAAVVAGVIAIIVSLTKGPAIRDILKAVFSTSAAAFWLFSCFSAPTHVTPGGLQRVCALNLRELGTDLRTYAEANGAKYPAPEKWCDLLVNEGGVDKRRFICPGAGNAGGEARCHYAINSQCEPNSPGDIVLLFETKGGWNQHGGLELLTFDNHKPGGANVLFNGGHVEFVKPEEAGKLKWNAEDANNVNK